MTEHDYDMLRQRVTRLVEAVNVKDFKTAFTFVEIVKDTLEFASSTIEQRTTKRSDND